MTFRTTTATAAAAQADSQNQRQGRCRVKYLGFHRENPSRNDCFDSPTA